MWVLIQTGIWIESVLQWEGGDREHTVMLPHCSSSAVTINKSSVMLERAASSLSSCLSLVLYQGALTVLISVVHLLPKGRVQLLVWS